MVKIIANTPLLQIEKYVNLVIAAIVLSRLNSAILF